MKRLYSLGMLGLCATGALLSACEKTKFRSDQPQPGVAAPTTTPTQTAKSPNENNVPSTGGRAPEIYNPQPLPNVTPIMGGLPPKAGTTETVPGLGGKPVLTVPPKVPFEPPVNQLPSIPPNKVPVQLRVAQLNFEAWWKNCLVVTIGSDTKEVGCNKTTPLNTVVEFLADKGVCNRMEVRVLTYFPVSGACRAGQPCNGPYNATVDIDKRSSEISSSVFFKAYDRNNILNRDGLIAIQDNAAAIKQEMDTYSASAPMSRWVRVYFEDQRRENLDAVVANLGNLALREERGIDFNDYVFDVRAQGVEYYIDGLEPMGCTRK